MTTKWILCLAAGTVASLVSLSSGAQEPAGDAPRATVRAWDLDLTKPQDAQTLYTRVRDAATALCEAEFKDYYRETRRRPAAGWTQRCVTRAVDAAVRDTGSPVLAAIHGRMDVAQRD
jgi:UrcA family protein